MKFKVFYRRIIERWREYMEELLEEDKQAGTEVIGFSGPEITLSEERRAMKRLKNNMLPDPDNIIYTVKY